MRYKRSSRIARHFLSPKFWPFGSKREFFNRHRLLRQLSRIVANTADRVDSTYHDFCGKGREMTPSGMHLNVSSRLTKPVGFRQLAPLVPARGPMFGAAARVHKSEAPHPCGRKPSRMLGRSAEAAL